MTCDNLSIGFLSYFRIVFSSPLKELGPMRSGKVLYKAISQKFNKRCDQKRLSDLSRFYRTNLHTRLLPNQFHKASRFFAFTKQFFCFALITNILRGSVKDRRLFGSSSFFWVLVTNICLIISMSYSRLRCG